MPKPLRIGMDMAATAGQKSGLGFYVENLADAMESLTGDHTIVRINRIQRNLRTPERIVWDQVGLPLAAITKKLDALFVPAFSAPRFPKPIVMTAHDIFGMVYPEQLSRSARWYWQSLLPNSMKRAKRLIAISEYTKQTLMEYLKIPEARISVVHPAASEQFRIIEDMTWIQKQLDSLRITTPFILAVGTIEPRKNYERLIEAFAFSSRGNATLVIVGKKGWSFQGIDAHIRKYHVQDAVRIVDYVNADQLLALYNACLFFVMPSIFEGFGLPALEAMHCAAPVIVSQNTSLPEVVGEAGMVFDPFDVSSIRERMDLLFRDPTFRLDMQKKSLQQAKQFSWIQSARKTMDIFHDVVRTRHTPL